MKADDRREALLDRLVAHVLAHGLPNSSLRPLAAAAGTSDRMLIYYFGDKAGLIAAILERGAAQLGEQLDALLGSSPRPVAQLADELHAARRDPVLWPYLRLWLEMAALAAHGDAVCRRVGEAVGRGFVTWTAARLDLPDGPDKARAAARLVRDVDAAALFAALGMEDVVEGL